jgi:hypothetical protein
LHDGEKPFAEQAMEKGAFRQTIGEIGEIEIPGESSDGHIFIFSDID